jgi:hypothetical protein
VIMLILKQFISKCRRFKSSLPDHLIAIRINTLH